MARPDTVEAIGGKEERLRERLVAELPNTQAQPSRPEPARERLEEIPKAAVSLEEARGTAERLNGVLSRLDRGVRFEVEDVDGRRQVKVVEEETRRVIKMLPPEGLEELSNRLSAALGVFLDSKG